MMGTMRILSLVLALAASCVAGAAPPGPFEAHYEVHRNGKLAGEARLALLRLDEDRWEWTSRTRGTRGLAALANLEIDERTVLRWRDERPELIESSYDQRAAWTSRHRTLRVDESTGTIASYDGKRAHTLRHAPQTIDVHLTALALMTSLARAEETLSYRVATRDEIETHRYDIVGSETVATPAGKFDARRVRRAREDAKRTSEFWLAASLGWLPVRVTHADSDGERIELKLVRTQRRAR